MIDRDKRLGFYDDKPMKWGGLNWRPVPDTDNRKWFCWNTEIFKTIDEDDIPDQLWVDLMKRALL